MFRFTVARRRPVHRRSSHFPIGRVSVIGHRSILTAAATLVLALLLPAVSSAAATVSHQARASIDAPSRSHRAAAGLPGGKAALQHCTHTVPVSCSFDVPPGNYELRLALGSRTSAANTGVQVEGRRTVLAPISTRRGQIVVRSLTVNVRTPESMPTGEEGPGTPGLQVYLTGDAPALNGIKVAPAPTQTPRLFIVSDSTASDWLFGPKRGWGQEIPQFFGDGLSVANYADSGESTSSWLANPTLFATVKPLIRPGDEVLIQLAHNDKQITEAAYRDHLQQLVDGVRSQGGLAILVTPPCRHLFGPDGKITPTGRVVNSLGVDLPAVMRDVASQMHAPLLDLTADSQALLQRLGPDASFDLYTVLTDGSGRKDQTHFNEYGATVIAGLVAHELAANGLPAAAYLR